MSELSQQCVWQPETIPVNSRRGQYRQPTLINLAITHNINLIYKIRYIMSKDASYILDERIM